MYLINRSHLNAKAQNKCNALSQLILIYYVLKTDYLFMTTESRNIDYCLLFLFANCTTTLAITRSLFTRTQPALSHIRCWLQKNA